MIWNRGSIDRFQQGEIRDMKVPGLELGRDKVLGVGLKDVDVWHLDLDMPPWISPL